MESLFIKLHDANERKYRLRANILKWASCKHVFCQIGSSRASDLRGNILTIHGSLEASHPHWLHGLRLRVASFEALAAENVCVKRALDPFEEIASRMCTSNYVCV